MSKKDVKAIRDHLFINKHELDNGFNRFDESVDIAQAWEALEQGRAKELDILLLKHELEELTLMQKYGYSYEKAHIYANLKYPWEYKKNGWSDDKINIETKRQLDLLL